MNVDDVVAAKIAAARLRAESERKARAARQAARDRGLAQRHAAKLRAQAARRPEPPAVATPEPEENPVTPHLQLISATSQPAPGGGDDWSAIHDGFRFAEEMVRNAQAAGLCVPCWQTDGHDARFCRGNGCRNATPAHGEGAQL